MNSRAIFEKRIRQAVKAFKKVLRFVPRGGNGFVFTRSVFHPGTSPDPFLYDSLENNIPNIINIFSQYTGNALDDVARGLAKDEYSITFNM